MSQGKVSERESRAEQEALKELSNHYIIKNFESYLEEHTIEVWKALSTPSKAHLRRMMALEQLRTGEAL